MMFPRNWHLICKKSIGEGRTLRRVLCPRATYLVCCAVDVGWSGPGKSGPRGKSAHLFPPRYLRMTVDTCWALSLFGISCSLSLIQKSYVFCLQPANLQAGQSLKPFTFPTVIAYPALPWTLPLAFPSPCRSLTVPRSFPPKRCH